MPEYDLMVAPLLGLSLILLALYLLRRLWGERQGRPGLVLVVSCMVFAGGYMGWAGVTRMLGQ